MESRIFRHETPQVEVLPNLVYDVLEEKNEVDRADIAVWYLSFI